jgi:hypothetical protein
LDRREIKRQEVGKKLHNEELHDLCSSPNVIRTVEEDEVGRACSMDGRTGMHMGQWWESQKERDHQEDQAVGG